MKNFWQRTPDEALALGSTLVDLARLHALDADELYYLEDDVQLSSSGISYKDLQSEHEYSLTVERDRKDRPVAMLYAADTANGYRRVYDGPVDIERIDSAGVAPGFQYLVHNIHMNVADMQVKREQYQGDNYVAHIRAERAAPAKPDLGDIDKPSELDPAATTEPNLNQSLDRE
jgi:hypothetical protein